MFSTLQKKITTVFGRATEEIEIFISHGRPNFLQVVRRSGIVVSEGSDESGTYFRVSGTPKQIEKLKILVGEKKKG